MDKLYVVFNGVTYIFDSDVDLANVLEQTSTEYEDTENKLNGVYYADEYATISE